jgi:hypothetical protein
VLWAVAAAGRIEPRPERAAAASRGSDREPDREPLGSSA